METGPASSEEAGTEAMAVRIPWHRERAPLLQGAGGRSNSFPICSSGLIGRSGIWAGSGGGGWWAPCLSVEGDDMRTHWTDRRPFENTDPVLHRFKRPQFVRSLFTLSLYWFLSAFPQI